MRRLLLLALCPSLALAAPPKGDKAKPPPVAMKEEAPPPPKEDDDVTKRARALYTEGLEAVKKAQWSEALSSFERSLALRPHATTVYNIGACERALGRYTRARVTLLRAIAQGEANAGQLPPSLATEARGYVEEIDRVLARVTITLEPPEAGMAVDGRPLAADESGAMVAGISAPGAGTSPPANKFELVVDPGTHLFTLTRKGYADILLNRAFTPGFRGPLRLELERLPATLHVSSSMERAVVTVNGADVGMAPVDVQRPPGSYRIIVKRDGFHPYQAQVNLNAGEDTDLRAALVEEKTPITKKWWFWVAAGVVVTGATVSTYYLTRTDPEPRRPPLDGGNLGWTAQIR